MEKDFKQEIERLKILNDIYKNENEQMKLEYTLLSYEYQTLLNKLNKNIAIRGYRKTKRILKRILRRK